jgi:hypothetical protein
MKPNKRTKGRKVWTTWIPFDFDSLDATFDGFIFVPRLGFVSYLQFFLKKC